MKKKTIEKIFDEKLQNGVTITFHEIQHGDRQRSFSNIGSRKVPFAKSGAITYVIKQRSASRC